MATFQQRHYIVIAAAIKAQRGAGYMTDTYDKTRLDALAEDLAKYFAGDNSSFKRRIFMRAAGVDYPDAFKQLDDALPYCDKCGEDFATLRLQEVGLCGDCGGDHLRPALEEQLGFKPCAYVLQLPDCVVVCLSPYGVEHDHQS